MALHTTRRLGLGAACVLLCGVAVAADGLNAPDGTSLWPAWQARLTLTTGGADQGLAVGSARHLRQAALLGDFYLPSRWLPDTPGWRGGLRATSGLVFGHLGALGPATGAPWAVNLLAIDDIVDVAAPGQGLRPYVGIGYSGLSVAGGWGVSADVGLVARQPGAALGLGRVMLGNQGMDGLLRDMDLSPMLRLGVSYTF
jgi:hypothetical protein